MLNATTDREANSASSCLACSELFVFPLQLTRRLTFQEDLADKKLDRSLANLTVHPIFTWRWYLAVSHYLFLGEIVFISWRNRRYA